MAQRVKWHVALATLLGGAVLISCDAEGQKMQEIRFDLGKNIVDTARASGVPRFRTSNVNGSIDYSVNQISAELSARFARPGYEISAAPIFSFRLSADHRNGVSDIVEATTLQINTFKSHDTAQAFVEQLLGQFAKGKWKRYIWDSCPAVTGRSALLDATGKLDVGTVCSLDPSYKLKRDEWLAMMSVGKFYRWVGDGVIAELQVGYGDNPATGVMYQMFLGFELEDVQKKRNAQADADHIKEGEAKGWNTAAKAVAGKKETDAMNKLLEANAIKRGDQVVPR